MITTEEAKRAFGNAMVAQCEDECNFNCDIVENYFTQQEKKDERAKKVEELLELYQEYFKLYDDMTSVWKKVYQLKIKALEEELK
jgi:hypothetical protein